MQVKNIDIKGQFQDRMFLCGWHENPPILEKQILVIKSISVTFKLKLKSQLLAR